MAISRRNQKSVDLPLFDKLLRGVWARLVSTLGVTSVRSVLGQALDETLVHYPVLEHIRVREGGVDLSGLEEHAAGEKMALLNQALWAYLETITRLVGRLCGVMVSRCLIDYITAEEKGRGFNALLYRTGLKF